MGQGTCLEMHPYVSRFPFPVSRGFADVENSGKLLALSAGRIILTPSFSKVHPLTSRVEPLSP
jgi:hypothetical protein